MDLTAAIFGSVTLLAGIILGVGFAPSDEVHQRLGAWLDRPRRKLSAWFHSQRGKRLATGLTVAAFAAGAALLLALHSLALCYLILFVDVLILLLRVGRLVVAAWVIAGTLMLAIQSVALCCFILLVDVLVLLVSEKRDSMTAAITADRFALASRVKEIQVEPARQWVASTKDAMDVQLMLGHTQLERLLGLFQLDGVILAAAVTVGVATPHDTLPAAALWLIAFAAALLLLSVMLCGWGMRAMDYQLPSMAGERSHVTAWGLIDDMALGRRAYVDVLFGLRGAASQAMIVGKARGTTLRLATLLTMCGVSVGVCGGAASLPVVSHWMGLA